MICIYLYDNYLPTYDMYLDKLSSKLMEDDQDEMDDI